MTKERDIDLKLKNCYMNSEEIYSYREGSRENLEMLKTSNKQQPTIIK